MLDQSFSVENFRKILDIENRKGNYLIRKFFPNTIDLDKKIKETRADIRAYKEKLKNKDLLKDEKDKYEKEKKELEGNRDILIKAKEKKLTEELTPICKRVSDSNFKLIIHKDVNITDKPVYTTKKNLENILTLKQLQYNFRKLYKVQQSSRNSIINQLKILLDDGFPKIILKTDIKDFYESIPHKILLKKLNNDNLLSHSSMLFINQILKEYNRISSKNIGIPRGIGISPYLAELYMRDIDDKIKQLPNLIYYARYVDDIILIFMPQIDNKIRDYKNEVKQILEKEGLEMNETSDKTKEIEFIDKSEVVECNLEYLGYTFLFGFEKRIDKKKSKCESENQKGKIIKQDLIVTISEKKKNRYIDRMKRAFDLYVQQSNIREKEARKLLINRIKFLTGNTRLDNNKINIFTGVYYSNSLITNTDELSDLRDLDCCLECLIERYSLPEKLATKIKTLKFVSGFKNPKRILVFTAIEFKKIMRNWKNEKFKNREEKIFEV